MQGRSTSNLDILNLALAFLGVDEVTDFDVTNSKGADKVKRFYNLVIDQIQRGYIWKELLTRTELVAVVDKPRFYDIPDSCLRPMGTRIDLTGLPQTTTFYDSTLGLRYDVEGQEIEVNYETDEAVELFHIRREDDPTKWSSELEEAIALGMATRACFLVTDNTNLLAQLQQDLHALTLPKARELQSKYAKNYSTLLPRGFSNLQARLS